MLHVSPSLQNIHVRLEALDVKHSDSLSKIVDDEMWMGMTSQTPLTEPLMSKYIETLLSDEQRISFVVVDKKSNTVVGSTCFYDYVASQGRIEIGSTFYSRSVWGGVVNPSVKLLMGDYAFNELNIHRLALRCDARNVRSISAIKKLGGVFEGTLRGHRLAGDGSRGDTMYFSILKPEWKALRAKLVERIESFA